MTDKESDLGKLDEEAGPQALVLGTTVGPFPDRFDADRLRRFAAVRGRSDRQEPAVAVPPGAAVTLLWAAQNAAREALVPHAFQELATGGVHGEHDLVLHRPVVPDEPLTTSVAGWGARPAGRNSVVTLRYATVDAAGQTVVEQWWSTVWTGVVCRPVGAAAPDHAFDDAARAHPAGSWTASVDEDMARRYAEASGDWSAHHFEVEAARRSGSDRPFLHGLCTLALCVQGMAETFAGGDGAALARVAVRFSRPMPLGEQLDVAFFHAGPRAIAFEARCGDRTIVSNGLAELR